MCSHSPTCARATDVTCSQAQVTSDHSEQGWCLLCVIVFDDGFYLSPAGEIGNIPIFSAA
jgi:hypothetical protein